jgi:DNA-binding transcriptional ArsR family regulator
MPGKPANEDLQPLSEIDKLIHEPARLMILATLHAVESADFLFVERQTGLTRGNLSSHMGKLETAGYIEIKKEFVDKIPRTLPRITDEGRAALLAYTDNMKRVLDGLR